VVEGLISVSKTSSLYSSILTFSEMLSTQRISCVVPACHVSPLLGDLNVINLPSIVKLLSEKSVIWLLSVLEILIL